MVTNWDPEMVERLERVERKVEAMASDLADIKRTVATQADVAELKRTTQADIAELKRTMATQADIAELRRTMATKAELEEVRDNIKRLAEGYEAMPKLIRREIAEALVPVTNLLAAHDLAIRDHSKRIAKLEQP